MADAAVPLVAQDARDAPPQPSAPRPLRVGFGTLRALAVLPAVCGGLLVAQALCCARCAASAWLSVACAGSARRASGSGSC